MATKPIPDGYNAVTPYLIVKNAAGALEFYKKTFGAVEEMRFAAPDGRIGHAEIRIGDSKVMVGDEYPEMDARGPEAFGGSPVGIHLYVADVDAVFARAVAEGAKAVQAPKDQFYGDRSARLRDPFGHSWSVATHVEDVSEEEMQRRMAAMSGH